MAIQAICGRGRSYKVLLTSSALRIALVVSQLCGGPAGFRIMKTTARSPVSPGRLIRLLSRRPLSSTLSAKKPRHECHVVAGLDVLGR